ncbi:GNAT family N-acetyltransferase [Pseudoalteromonas sp. McH1-7]|uniref:GNAT family N-acetyltransferase n=1 Tax=Pseudoalteromonas TaxID=53246 RepID=UPI00117156F2|nr:MULTISPECIES: GNAT family N-acetyltransferase [Pseudoalteromonas]NLR15352.1 GNAT family N-acetyltransferase [Pseudoalteromonas peptidolytica]NUZ12688.1 GNAT family N-acetyltransferase [Pseudoalteromonas sp. McH1-7]GEK10128.1 molybdopterin-guanine dinucleotide biosynthesis protein MobC [Pseudoalteromonas peptidolytica]
MELKIVRGWHSRHVQAAAELYIEAFGRKFKAAVADRDKLVAIIAKSFVTEYAFGAFEGENLLGIAGFQDAKKGFTSNIDFAVLKEELGFFGAIKAAAIFSLFDRAPAQHELVMDGIAVSKQARGKGIGTALLHAVQNYTRENGFKTLRLDVIDNNPKAKQLYLRTGFVASHHDDFSYLEWLVGFSGATTMHWRP